MDYHLEREIRLSEESEYKSLYSWSLQEFDDDGTEIGTNQVPWQWSLSFTASELRILESIHIEESDDSEDEVEENNPIEESQTIMAILHPGICNDGQWLQDVTSFPMFGTDRRIRDFVLGIYKLDEGNANERCKLWGCVSYTSEIDFGNETTDDTVEISIWLSPQRFISLAEMIKTQRADVIQVRLGRVSGFYSEWSPSISTSSVKILAAADDQEVVSPKDSDITPPRLGEVGEFDLTIIQRSKLNPKQDLRGINIYRIFGEDDEVEEDDWEEEEGHAEPKPDVNTVLLDQLSRNERRCTNNCVTGYLNERRNHDQSQRY